MDSHWPTRNEEQQQKWAKLCSNFYEDGIFACCKEGMKVVFTGPHEATIECVGPSGRMKINNVDTTIIDPCLLMLT